MNLTVNKKTLFSIIISSILSLVLAAIPWELWRGSEYYDRENYTNTIDDSLNKIYWFDYDTFLSKLSNEWLWHKFLDFSVDTLHLNSAEILYFISVFLVFTSSLFLARRYGYLSVIFLLNPLFINFMYSQLRLAFVMALLFVSYYLYKKNNKLYLLLVLITPFIHTSAVTFVAMFAAALMFEKTVKIKPIFKTTLSILIGLGIGIATGPLMSTILTAIDDRRSEYTDMSSSIVYMSFWLILFAYFSLKGLFESKHRTFSFYISLMVLALVAVQAVMGGYASRFLVALFPFVIAAMLETKAKEQPIVIISYLAYSFMLWFYWINYG